MICTYYSLEEQEKYSVCTDKDINDLLTESNKKTDCKFFITEREVYKPRLFRRTAITTVYSLYRQRTPNNIEVININFCQDHDWSINISVTKSYIVTYLLGYLSK